MPTLRKRHQSLARKPISKAHRMFKWRSMLRSYRHQTVDPRSGERSYDNYGSDGQKDLIVTKFGLAKAGEVQCFSRQQARRPSHHP